MRRRNALVGRIVAVLVSIGLLLGAVAGWASGEPAGAPAGPPSWVDAPHIRAELLSDRAAIAPGDEARIAVRFVMEPGWHVYFRNPGDSGEAPRISFRVLGEDGGTGPLQFGDPLWPTPHRLVSGPLTNYGYKDELVLMAPVRLRADGAAARAVVTVVADVHWLVCSEPCIPGQAQLGLTLAVQGTTGPGAGALPASAGHAAVFARAQAAVPQPVPADWGLQVQATGGALILRATLPLERAGGLLHVVPRAGGVIEDGEDSARQVTQWAGGALTLTLHRSDQLRTLPPTLQGVLLWERPGEPAMGYALDSPILEAAAVLSPGAPGSPASPVPPQQPLWLLILSALLGGALLNLMPCVFPVLSIKALELVQTAALHPTRARLHGALYGAGVLVSFWGLAGLLIALRLAGQQLGWGFHLQSPRFLMALSALLFLLSLNLLGVFELGLGLTQLGQLGAAQPADGHARNGRGLGAAFLTGVLATVVATPCTAPFMGTAVGFALGQSAPVALVIFSALAAGLALPYVLLTWVPALRRLLPRPGRWMETFKQAMAFPLLATVIWLMWVLGAQVGWQPLVTGMAGLLAVAMAGWVWGRWPATRVAWACGLLLLIVGAAGPGAVLGRLDAPVSAATETARDGVAWVPYSPQALAAQRQAGRAVFVDFTAEWCVSCKVNERLVLQSAAVQARLRERGVVAMKADWTRYDPQITQALATFGRSGIPFYVLYGRDPSQPPRELPVLLTTDIVLSALDELR